MCVIGEPGTGTAPTAVRYSYSYRPAVRFPSSDSNRYRIVYLLKYSHFFFFLKRLRTSTIIIFTERERKQDRAARTDALTQ